jgi:hypothetical protein
VQLNYCNDVILILFLFIILLYYFLLGQTVGSALFSVMFLFSGFFIARPDIPNYWIWLHYLSLFKYGFDSSMVNAFQVHVTTDDMDNNALLDSLGVAGIDRGTGKIYMSRLSSCVVYAYVTTILSLCAKRYFLFIFVQELAYCGFSSCFSVLFSITCW